MTFLKNCFNQLFSPKDRRVSDRLDTTDLIAYFFTGSMPEPRHEIRDFSSTGIYVVTDQRFYPGTLVSITLQKANEVAKGAERTVFVQCQVMRTGEDGLGLKFVPSTASSKTEAVSSMRRGVDKKTLDTFLAQFKPKARKIA